MMRAKALLDAGHFALEEKPDAIAAHTDEFLSRTLASSPPDSRRIVAHHCRRGRGVATHQYRTLLRTYLSLPVDAAPARAKAIADWLIGEASQALDKAK
jgi:hypothetical protein